MLPAVHIKLLKVFIYLFFAGLQMCSRYICVLFREEFWDETEEISVILSSILSVLFVELIAFL